MVDRFAHSGGYVGRRTIGRDVGGAEEFYFDLLGLIPARRLWFAGVEWLFSIGCMVLYLVMQSRMPRLWYVRGFVALLGATNSLYHFPVLFAVVTVLGFEGAAAGDAQVVFTQYLFDEAVLLRAAHFIGAAVIVTAAFLMSLCLRAARADGNGADKANTVIQQAGWMALVAMGAEIVLGISMLSVLPDAAHRALLGGNLLAAVVFFASVIAVVGSLHHLGLICLGNCDARHVTRLGAYLLLIVVLMSAVRFMSHRAVWRIRPDAAKTQLDENLCFLIAVEGARVEGRGARGKGLGEQEAAERTELSLPPFSLRPPVCRFASPQFKLPSSL